MPQNTKSHPRSSADLPARVRAEEIASVYATGPSGVIGALAAAAALATSIAVIDAASAYRAFSWAAVLTLFGFGHLLLCRLYANAASSERGKVRWRRYLCGFYLAEGLIWGWGAARLAPPDRIYDQFLVYIIVGSVTAGSVTVIANYLPAFYTFFFATLAPLILQGLYVEDALRRIAAIYAVILGFAMLALAGRVNRTFVQHLNLRFQAQDLAEELRRQRELAEQASISKSRFLASASHDLRQPVHALGMFVGALKGRAMDDEARRLVTYIEGSVSAMDDLFGSLLDISRLDAGIVEVSPGVFPIQRLLERIWREFEGDASAKGIRLKLRRCGALVRSDPVLLECVLRNIVSNAVRYTERGRIVIGCRRGPRLVVQVWDSGRGIPADRQDAVFEEFFQISNQERDRTKGLGLGLAIVRRLTTLLDCRLTLCSEPGLGSVFSVAIPLAPSTCIETTEPFVAEAASCRHAFIAIVDDEKLVREAMRSLLLSWGHTVVDAGSGDEILGRLVDCPDRPDLIICDYRLRDGETGVAVIRRLQDEYNTEIPCMLITGDTGADRLIEARASGFLLLHKPIADAKLRAAIGNLLRDAIL